MPNEPFLSFLSDLSKKIAIEREHKQLMEKINSSEIDQKDNSLEKFLNTLKIKLESPAKDEVKSDISIEEIIKRDLEDVVIEVNNEEVEDVSFNNFVGKLKGILDSKPDENTKAPSTSAVQVDKSLEIEDKEVGADDYVEELEKIKNGIAIEKGDDKVTEIKKLIEEYAEKYLKRAVGYAGESGGGSVAKQFANGGTMEGDLNVTGNYLSGGINLLNIFSGGSSGNPAVNSLVQSNSAAWNSTYTTVSTFSASWSTGIQTLAFNSSNYNLSISNGNTVNLGSLKDDLSEVSAASANWNNTYSTVKNTSAYWADTRYNVTFANDVTVNGNLTALGTSTFKNTIFTTTSALSVYNTGPGPALYVFQAAGPSDVASFYDGDGIEVLHVGNANSGQGGKVGINESNPSVIGLTVNGQISSNNTITAQGGNSNQWNSTTTSFFINSAKYDSTFSTVTANSGFWSQAYTNLVSNSALYLGIENVKNLQDNEYALNLDQFTIYTKRVSAENVFTYTNFVSGRTLTVYLSANHVGAIGHYFPVKTYFGSNGTSNVVYTFSGYATKVIVQNVGDYFLGTTFLIPIDVQQYPKAGDYMLMEGFGFILQEDNYRIILD